MDHLTVINELETMRDITEYLLENTTFKNFNDFVVNHLNKVKKIKKSLKLIDKIYKKIYKNPATLDVIFSRIVRGTISKRFGNNSEEHQLSKELVALDYSVKGELINKQRESLINKQKSVINFDKSFIIELIEECINSNNIPKQFLGLILCSGSRPSELLSDNTFEIIDDYWIIQNFTSKKKGAPFPIKKPIIAISPQKFINIVNSVKNFKDIQRKANIITKEILDTNLYSARKIYAALSHQLFSKNSIYGPEPTFNYWASNVLGHKKNDLMTANHYNNFKIF